MKVVGLTGTIGSGKEVVKEFLEKNFNTATVTLSSLLKEESLIKKGIKITRDIRQNLGNELRKQYGPEILVKIAIGFMPRNKDLLVIDGLRNPAESDFLKKNFGENYKLVGVDAPKEVRFDRTLKRGKESDPKTFEEFLQVDERDQGKGEPSYGQQVGECMQMADFVVDNSGTMEELKRKLQELLKVLE